MLLLINRCLSNFRVSAHRFLDSRSRLHHRLQLHFHGISDTSNSFCDCSKNLKYIFAPDCLNFFITFQPGKILLRPIRLSNVLKPLEWKWEGKYWSVSIRKNNSNWWRKRSNLRSVFVCQIFYPCVATDKLLYPWETYMYSWRRWEPYCP